MTEESEEAAEHVAAARPARTLWWFWLAGVLALLWNGFGAFDFAASAAQGDEWYRTAGMSEAQIAYMHSYPAWMWVVWCVGTWGGLAASLLLLARRRLAFPAFVLSLIGFVLSLVYEYLLSDGGRIMSGMAPMQATIFVLCLAEIGFARFATKRGVLR